MVKSLVMLFNKMLKEGRTPDVWFNMRIKVFTKKVSKRD